MRQTTLSDSLSDSLSVTEIITDITAHRTTQTQQLHIAQLFSQNNSSQDEKTNSEILLNTSPVTVEIENKEDVVESQEREHSILVNLASGAMAGALAKSTIAPLDRTKIYFQATQQRYTFMKAFTFLKECHSKDGFISLWRGNSATMARIVPYAAIQFGSHEQFKHILKVDQGDVPTPSWVRFFAGSLAGVTSQSLVYPLDMARARMAVTHKNTYSSLGQVFSKIWKHEGPLTLYRGFTPTILGVIPYAGTSFGIYETLKHHHKVRSEGANPNPFERMLFGSIAGLFGQSCSYPLDIVRRRMQTASITGNGQHYKTIKSTLLKVYRDEGLVHGLYKGLSLNWIKGPLAVGISFSTFDTMKQFLSKLDR